MLPDPVIIVPDTTPLIHLAAGGLLDTLTAIGRVVVPDVVALEATRRPDKPWAAEIADWLGSSTAVIVETELGSLYRLAIDTGLSPPRHAGEISVIAWLRANLTAAGQRALLVFEDSRVPRMLEVEPFRHQVIALTTRSFLEFAEARGIILSAEDAFKMIERGAPTASRLRFRSKGADR